MRTRLIALTSVLLLDLLAAGVLATELPVRKSSVSGVTVAITPQNLAEGAVAWEFRVALDTHSGDLGDDLTKSAELVDNSGRRHAPTGWNGASPGGHHREGVLRFKPVSPRPSAIEIRITRKGEAVPRVFRWQLE